MTERYFDVLPGFLMKNESDLAPHRNRMGGVLNRFIIFIYFSFRRMLVGERALKVSSDSRYLFFCSSYVQFKALQEVYDAMSERGENVIFIVEGDWTKACLNEVTSRGGVELTWARRDALFGLLMGMFRLPFLLYSSRSSRRGLFTKYFLDRSLNATFYLLIFHRICSAKSSLRAVVVSNDHNIQSRALRYVAATQGIKTFFIQHSSVGVRYPPLEFDVALLEGRDAHTAYVARLQEAALTGLTLDNRTRTRSYLCGVKVSPHEATQSKHGVGVLVNQADCWHVTKAFIDLILEQGREVVMRIHPRQSRDFICAFLALAEMKDGLSMSDPRTDSLPSFISRVDLAICSNTSVARELLVMGVPVLYRCLSSDSSNYDRYGYVSSGLLADFEVGAEISRQRERFLSDNARKVRLRELSETYGTCWQCSESTLMSSVIVCETSSSQNAHEAFIRDEYNNDLFFLAENYC